MFQRRALAVGVPVSFVELDAVELDGFEELVEFAPGEAQSSQRDQLGSQSTGSNEGAVLLLI